MQKFSVSLDGVEGIWFSCEQEDSILSGALRNGRGFPYECNSGGCGSCQFELVDGEVVESWPQAPGLSPRARARGKRLACQCVPISDCTIRVRSDKLATPVISPRKSQMELVQTRRLTHDMSEFTLRSPSRAEFLPGQFVMLGLPGVEGLRAYSMSNLANDDGLWSLIIKRIPGGKGTTVMFDSLKLGDVVSVDGPYGNSYLRIGSGRDIVCIAGGSGLSPVLSILRGAARSPELADRKLSLFYGGRGPQDLCVNDMLDNDPLLRDRVVLYTAISDENAPGATEWQGERGFVHELVRKTLGYKIPVNDFYFCGPPPMSDAVHRMLLLDYKVPASQLFFDRFF